MSRERDISLPVVTSLTFAGSFVAAKYAVYELPPLTITLLRYIIALAFLSLLICKYKTTSLKISSGHVFALALMGLTGVIGYHFFFFTALRHTAVTNTAIINATSPVVIGILAAIILKERLRLINYLGVIISVGGVVLLITRGRLSALTGLDLNVGEFYMFCAVISWAVYALIAKRLTQRYSGFTVTFYSALFGVIVLLPLSLTENGWAAARTLTAASIYALLYMGIIASGIGYFCYNLSIIRIGPTKTASFVYSLVPIIVAILALIFFAESMTPVMAASAVLIIIGLNFMLRKKIESPAQT